MQSRNLRRRPSDDQSMEDDNRTITRHKRKAESNVSSSNVSDSDDDLGLQEVRRSRRNRAASKAEENEGESDDDDEDNIPVSQLRRQGTRRSSRGDRSKRIYVAEDDDDDFESETESSDSDVEEDDSPDENVIDKVLGRRIVTNAKSDASTRSESDCTELYLVKYKGCSYIHCEWIPRADIESSPANSKKLQKFIQSEDSGSLVGEADIGEDDDEATSVPGFAGYFPSQYCRIDRVFSHRVLPTSTQPPKLSELESGSGWDQCEFLVRWQQQGYDDATWEEYSSLASLPGDEAKPEIARYFRFCKPRKAPQPSSKTKERKRQTNRSSAASLAWKAQSFPTLNFTDGLALRDYQIDGVKWMSFNWSQNRNSILADEMGLGKTVQISAFIHHLATNEGVRGPFLVVAPLSTLQHWRRESEAWAPELNCIVYHGGAAARDIIREYEFRYDRKYQEKQFKFDILVTSYEMVLADAKILSRIDWDVTVVDESHRLKNRDSKLFRELVRFKMRHIIMLTGTPVQNSIEELWVLLHFIDPDVFDSIEEFQDKFGDLKRKEDVDNLHAILKPYFLRRMKSDVEKDLPDRQEIVIDVEMTMLQKRLYKAIYDKNTEFLVKKTSMPSLMNIGMQLRKCCNHPYLIRGVEDEQLSGDLSDQAKMDLLVAASGKFVLLDKLLPKLKLEGHRVLIFSQMCRMLDIIEDYLNHREYRHKRIDGNIRGSDRQLAIDEFTKDPDIFVFMLATRAGGVGINLTAADTVLIFDSDWNPQNDLQAQARCHRIGQTQHVKVYRLITKNTYEMAMFSRASLKLGLDQAVLHPMTTNTKGNAEKLSKKDIENLLKNGAYSIVEEKSDQKSKDFCEKDIDDILASNSRLIQYSSNPSMAGSSFAKASFVITSENGEEALDIDDPKFWEKVGFTYEPSEKENDLILFDTRKRRRVQRFVGYTDFDANKTSKNISPEPGDKDDAPFSPGDSEGSGSEDDEESQVQGENKKPEAKREPSVIQEIVEEGGWSICDRDCFMNVLVAFGYDRWDVIRQYIALDEAPRNRAPHTPIASRSDDELRLAALCIISACMSADTAVGPPTALKRTTPSPIRNLLTSHVLAHDLQTVLRSQGVEWEFPNRALKINEQRVQMEAGFASLTPTPSFTSPSFHHVLARQAKGILQSLERCFVLSFSVDKVCGVDLNFMLLAECAYFKLTAALPDPNWSMADDAALLKGAFTYGQGNFDAINMDTGSVLYGRLKLIPGATKPDLSISHSEAQRTTPEPARFPTTKALTSRLRALLTNLGKQVFKITSRPLPVQGPVQVPVPHPAPRQRSSSATSQHSAAPPPGDAAPVPAPPPIISSGFDPAVAASQVLHPNQIRQLPSSVTPVAAPAVAAPAGVSPVAAYESYLASAVPPPVRADGAVLNPLQLVAEYRSLTGTAEELLHSFPNHLMDVLHKSHYLNMEFETKESEARRLSDQFPMLKGPVDALGDNARDLCILFRRIRRRSNKILHIQQIMNQWGQENGYGPDSKLIPPDAHFPDDLAEKRRAEIDLFARITECLDAVSRLNSRNRLILSRLEHLASSRD